MNTNIRHSRFEAVEVFYFNCKECGAPLDVEDRHIGLCEVCIMNTKNKRIELLNARNELTAKQAADLREAVLAEFCRCIRLGKVPRMKDVGDTLGVHLVTVSKHLDILEAEGRVVRRDDMLIIPSMKGVDWEAVNKAGKSAAVKSRKQRKLSEAERIERVVERAKQRELVAGAPFHEKRGLFRNDRLLGTKV